MNPPMGTGGPTAAPGTAKPRVGPGPTVDGRLIVIRSFFDAAPEISKNVPLLFGSVSEEGNFIKLEDNAPISCCCREASREAQPANCVRCLIDTKHRGRKNSRGLRTRFLRLRDAVFATFQ
jgi:hypothetical protein